MELVLAHCVFAVLRKMTSPQLLAMAQSGGGFSVVILSAVATRLAEHEAVTLKTQYKKTL